MPLDFTPSWMSAELADGRASCERFVEREMLPADEEARRRGHVGHVLGRRRLHERVPDRAPPGRRAHPRIYGGSSEIMKEVIARSL